MATPLNVYFVTYDSRSLIFFWSRLYLSHSARKSWTKPDLGLTSYNFYSFNTYNNIVLQIHLAQTDKDVNMEVKISFTMQVFIKIYSFTHSLLYIYSMGSLVHLGKKVTKFVQYFLLNLVILFYHFSWNILLLCFAAGLHTGIISKTYMNLQLIWTSM